MTELKAVLLLDMTSLVDGIGIDTVAEQMKPWGVAVVPIRGDSRLLPLPGVDVKAVPPVPEVDLLTFARQESSPRDWAALPCPGNTLRQHIWETDLMTMDYRCRNCGATKLAGP